MMFKRIPQLGFTLVILLSVVMGIMPTAHADDGPANEEVEQLRVFVGNWDVAAHYQNEDGEWQDGVGVSTIDWGTGGHSVREELVVAIDGKVYELILQRLYTNKKRRYDAAWGDNATQGMFTGAAQFDGQTMVINGKGVGPLFRITTTALEDGTLTSLMERAETLSSAYETQWELTYTPQTDESPTPEDIRVMGDPFLDVPDSASGLEPLIGDWEAVFERYIDEDTIAETTVGTDQFRTVLSGWAVEQNWRGEIEAKPAAIWTLTKYNPEDESWDVLWWDSDFDASYPIKGLTCDSDSCTAELPFGGPYGFSNITDNSFDWIFTGNIQLGSHWAMTYTRLESQSEE